MNSVSTVLIPISDPTSPASLHGTPMSHASGDRIHPKSRSSVRPSNPTRPPACPIR